MINTKLLRAYKTLKTNYTRLAESYNLIKDQYDSLKCKRFMKVRCIHEVYRWGIKLNQYYYIDRLSICTYESHAFGAVYQNLSDHYPIGTMSLKYFVIEQS